VRVEMIEDGSKVVERPHDLVVLSVGMLPGYDPHPLYGVSIADDGFAAIPAPNIRPSLTAQPGIFAAGTTAGPMDIVDSIVMAGAAAAEAAAHLEETRRSSPQFTAAKEVVHA
jgi:heterodisulfide reductase subunit A